MKYKDLHLSKQVYIKGRLYSITSIKTHGLGPLFGCKTYNFKPVDHNGQSLIAFQWEDGEIYGIKKEIERTVLNNAAHYNHENIQAYDESSSYYSYDYNKINPYKKYSYK